MPTAIVQNLPTAVTNPRALPLVTPIIRDYFTGATGPLTDAADGNTVRAWQDVATGAWIKDGGAARASATPASTTQYITRVEQPSVDVVVTARLAAEGSTSATTNGAGIVALYLDAGNHLRLVHTGGTTGWRLQRVIANAPVTLFDTNIVEEALDTITLQVIGNVATIAVQPDGGAVQSFPVTIPDEFLAVISGASTLYAGLRSPRNGSTSSASFDSFEVRQAIIA
ncbi:hypothetical protein [Microbacterium testaceum]|uniref:hypothetical protein n=1 Tax=Microbacterium testaceum TaxID=2033 RepID=UPI001D17B893|nr:hypothetical protein [Microbacterium testaceum]MCC4249528.1 hypothetical protein [Microbacterium testaceum]